MQVLSGPCMCSLILTVLKGRPYYPNLQFKKKFREVKSHRTQIYSSGSQIAVPIGSVHVTLLRSVPRSAEVFFFSSPAGTPQMQEMLTLAPNHCCSMLIPKDSSPASLSYRVVYAASFHVPQALFSEFFGVFSQRNSSAPPQRGLKEPG